MEQKEGFALFSKFIGPIKEAVFFFPLVAAFITIPYAIYEYRKYGAILFLRTVLVYSFVLYMMCAYFLIILPLPDPEKVAQSTAPYYQLIPFNDVIDIFRTCKVDWSRPATYYKLIWNSAFFQVLFNILLTVPFGVYMRYFFKRSRMQTLCLTFCLSLFFELTQLSGLYGLYPRPYRLADVCDLMSNTLGGFIGYCAAPRLTGWLPTPDRMKEVAYQRSQKVSLMRRIFAAGIDCVVLMVLMVAALQVIPNPPSPSELTASQRLLYVFGYYTLFVLFYFGILEWLLGGRTPGKLMLHIRLADSRTMKRPKLWQCLVRYGLFYVLILPMPLLALVLAGNSGGTLEVVVSLALLMLFVIFCVFVIIHTGIRGGKLPHAYCSQTEDVNTMKRREKTGEKKERAVAK